MRGIKTGYGTSVLPYWALFNLYVIYIITSIPGLAITPIMGTLQHIFPGTTQLETQFLELGPNIAAIPFVFIGGAIGTRFNNMKVLNWTCLFYGIGGAAFFIAPNMITLIILSFAIGIAAGVISPLASAFVSDLFNGKARTRQYGFTSAVLNLVLMVSVIATGYLAKINWRLPFLIYLLPFIPLFFAAKFKKYIKEPADIRKSDAAQNKTKVHYKFSKEVNVPTLVRYCIYYFIITFVIAAISLYIPFLFKNSSTAGDLTSILFLGIMASGFTLNWCLSWLKKNVAVLVLFAIFVGFLLMVVSNVAVVVGIGIFIASYFYGVAQPYYYDRLSVISSRLALTLTMAIFAIMDSAGNVLAPFVIDGLADLFKDPTSTHPLMAFKICLAIIFFSTIVVLIRQIIVRKRGEKSVDPSEYDFSHPLDANDKPLPSADAAAHTQPATAPAAQAVKAPASDSKSSSSTTTNSK